MTTAPPQEPHHQKSDNRPTQPYWKRMHHDWKFWVAFLFVLLALGIYVLSNDLSMRPNNQMQQRVP